VAPNLKTKGVYRKTKIAANVSQLTENNLIIDKKFPVDYFLLTCLFDSIWRCLSEKYCGDPMKLNKPGGLGVSKQVFGPWLVRKHSTWSSRSAKLLGFGC